MKQEDNKTKTDALRMAVQRREERREKFTIPDGFDNLVMESISQSRLKPKRRAWLYATVGAIAASVVLLLTLHHIYNNIEPRAQQPMSAKQDTKQERTAKMVEDIQEQHETGISSPTLVKPSLVKKDNVEKKKVSGRNNKISSKGLLTSATSHAEDPVPQALSDTLGDGIWQRKENVIRAIEMLAEYDENGKQRERNVIREATFKSMPRQQGLQLMVCENGDYLIVDTSQKQIIEL